MTDLETPSAPATVRTITVVQRGRAARGFRDEGLFMEINRNQYFLAGLVLLFLGIQFRLTQSMTITPEASRALAEYLGHPVVAASNTVEAISGAELSIPPQTLRPPEWLGWCLASIGAVLILHSFAMPRPS